jgi:hypothetical protein
MVGPHIRWEVVRAREWGRERKEEDEEDRKREFQNFQTPRTHQTQVQIWVTKFNESLKPTTHCKGVVVSTVREGKGERLRTIHCKSYSERKKKKKKSKSQMNREGEGFGGLATTSIGG